MTRDAVFKDTTDAQWGSTTDAQFVKDSTYYDMWGYLSTVTADNDVTLTVRPTNVLVEEGTKNIMVYHGDDVSQERISLSSTSVFYVSLQWEPLSEADSGTIMDFFHSKRKGCGTAKSFLWTHYGELPDSRHTYTVRFASDLPRAVKRGNIYGITNVKLKVLGRS